MVVFNKHNVKEVKVSDVTLKELEIKLSELAETMHGQHIKPVYIARKEVHK